MTKSESLGQQYKKSLKRFQEVLKEQKNEITRDSAIKRFEIIFDIAWNLIKEFLEENKGIVCSSPKDCFRAAYKSGVIKYDELWIEMTNWRNKAVHTYSEEFVVHLYEKLPKTLKKFEDLKKKLCG